MFTFHARPKTSTRRIAALAAVLATALSAAPAAQASHTPDFRLGELRCLNGGLLRISPPPMMRSVYDVNHRTPELVKWSPDLRIWTRNGWRDYDTRRPFYTAFTTFRYGYSNTVWGQGWGGNIGQVQFVPFDGLRAGTYRIRHWLYWNKLGRTYRAESNQTCTFR